jgi:hypothetical protein
MNPNRRHWNQGQQLLQRALARPGDHPEWKDLFLAQHAVLHASPLAAGAGWSFDDEVWQGLGEAAARCLPPGGEHSIAWMTWHIARIEDATMNVLLAGAPQLLRREGWLERLGVPVQDTGNAMTPQEIQALSAAVDLAALRAYRQAVGCRTQEIVRTLQAADLKAKVAPARLQQMLAEGVVEQAARGLLDYWGTRTLAGLLLMPATRHIFIHLNEALRVKQKCR